MSEFKKEDAKFDSELDWMAFCYVADELTGEELETFEARLAREQEVRDAVVRAVNLVQDVYLSGNEEHEVRLRATSPALAVTNPIGWVWKVAAVVLLGVSVGAWWWNQNPDPNRTVAETPSEALAVAWVDSLEESDLDEMELDLNEEFGFEDEAVNEWMVSALSELEDSDLELTN